MVDDKGNFVFYSSHGGGERNHGLQEEKAYTGHPVLSRCQKSLFEHTLHAFYCNEIP